MKAILNLIKKNYKKVKVGDKIPVELCDAIDEYAKYTGIDPRVHKEGEKESKNLIGKENTIKNNPICQLCSHFKKEVKKTYQKENRYTCTERRTETNDYGVFHKGCSCIHDPFLEDRFIPVSTDTTVREQRDNYHEWWVNQNHDIRDKDDKIQQLESVIKTIRGLNEAK